LFIVDTTPPVFTHEPDDITIECDSIAPNCNVETIEGLPVQTSYRTMDSYMSSVTYFAIDCANNSVIHTQTIVKIDSTPPVFTRTPLNETAPCDCGALPAPTLAAVDNCEDDIEVSYAETQLVVPGVPVGAYPQVFLREWTASDGTNTESHTQWVTLEDNDAPDIILDGQISNAATINMGPMSCDATALYITSLLDDSLVQDNCDMSPTIGRGHSKVAITNGCQETDESHTVTLVASDVSGNSRTSVITFGKLDMNSPIVATLPSPLPVQCSATPIDNMQLLKDELYRFTTDDCTTDLTFSFTDITERTFTFTVTDNCGNDNTQYNAEYICVL